MNHDGDKNHTVTIGEMVALLSQLRSGNLTGQLENVNYPEVLKPVVDEINSLAQHLQAQDQAQAQAERDRKDLSKDLDSVQEMAKIGSWSYDFISGQISWSKQMFEIFPEDAARGTPSFERHSSTIHPDDRQLWKSTVEKCLADGKPYAMRFRSVFPDRHVWIDAHGQGLTGIDGKVIGLFGTCQDVTETIIQELQLAASKDQLEKAEIMAKIGSWELNLATYLGSWSKGQLAIFGLDRLKGAPSFEEFMGFVHPDDRSLVLKAFENILKDKAKEFQLIFRILLQDGKIVRWVKERGELLLTQEGVPDRLVGTIQDITEEKLSGDRIEQLKNQLELISDNMPGPVSQVDRHGRYVYASKLYYEHFGKTSEQILGKTHQELLPHNVFLQAEANIKRALSGERVHHEVPFVTASGKKLFVQTTFIPFLGQDGRPDGFLTVVHDITALKQAEAKLIHVSRLASLGEMSAGIAHEINNPLAIISGSVDLLSKFADNPEKLASRVAAIKKSCERISKIVSGLKKFSRSDDRSNFALHDLSKVVTEAMILVESKSKRLDTPVTLDCQTHANVSCDEAEIEQVLVNLINNAIDAVKDKPEKWVKISLTEETSSIVLRIIDSGLGISEDVRSNLFQPFFTTKKVGEGTGLGLSITKGILDGHKATISVVADCPHTCFEIRFPKEEAAKDAA